MPITAQQLLSANLLNDQMLIAFRDVSARMSDLAEARAKLASAHAALADAQARVVTAQAAVVAAEAAVGEAGVIPVNQLLAAFE